MATKKNKARRKVYKKTQRAGKFIFAGSSGCTFRPALKCLKEDDRRPGKISKLMDEESAKDEFEIRDLLKDIDPTFDYLIYPEDICVPDIESATAEDNYEKCSLIDLKNKYIKPTVLILPDGGTNLWDINVEKEDLLPFFEGFLNILKGVELLHSKGIAHLDIKPHNMVGLRLVTGEYKLRLIDFGLTRMAEKASKQRHFENYSYWPFDIKLTTNLYVYNPKDVADYYRAQKIRGSYYPEWLWYDKHGDMIIDKQLIIAIREVITSGTATAVSLIYGVDIFSLGRSLAEIYGRLLRHRYMGYNNIKVETATGSVEIQEEIKNFVSLPVYKLVEKMIDVNLFERPSITEVIRMYEEIMPAMREHLSKFGGAATATAAAVTATAAAVTGTGAAATGTGAAVTETGATAVKAAITAL